jgi:flavin-binding protein dodecin
MLFRDMVFKKITLMGTSGAGFENAVDDAVTRAGMTLDNIRWIEVVEQRVQIDGLNDREYQVEVAVAFELEE